MAPARAEEVSGARLRALAAEAQRDPGGARAALRRIDRVDGAPVAVGAAVAGAPDDALAARVRLLADELAARRRGAREAPAGPAARAVLAQRRFRGTEVPRPFTGVIRWLGARIESAVERVRGVLRRLPGGEPAGLGLLAALVVAGAVLLARGTIRRRAGRSAAARAAASAGRPSPRALEREAERAERAGEWERAVRLRFQAGLLALDARGALAYRPSLTTEEIAAAIASPAFAEVGRDFDRIAYGGRPAGGEDAARARRGWDAVLAEVSPR